MITFGNSYKFKHYLGLHGNGGLLRKRKSKLAELGGKVLAFDLWGKSAAAEDSACPVGEDHAAYLQSPEVKYTHDGEIIRGLRRQRKVAAITGNKS